MRKIRYIQSKLIKWLNKYNKKDLAEQLSAKKNYIHRKDLMGKAIQQLKPLMSDNKRFIKIEKLFSEIYQSYDEIKKEADKIGPTVTKKFSSIVEIFASMPIYGVEVVNQAESFSAAKGEYEISVLSRWSPVLELYARGLLYTSPGSVAYKKTVQDWANSVASKTLGPRKYTDNKGRRWYLGFVDIPESDFSDPVKKSMAEMEAMAMANFSKYSSVESWKLAKTISTEKSTVTGGSETEIIKSFAQKLAQRIKNIKTHSILITETNIRHPITNKPLKAIVYGIQAGSVEKGKHNEATASNGGVNNQTISPEETSVANYHPGFNTVIAYGTGIDRNEAIRNALIEAVRMVNGGFLAADKTMQKSFASIKAKINKSEVVSAEARAESFKEKIKELTQGYIKGYKIINIAEQKEVWEAKLSVEVLRYDPDHPRGDQPATLLLSPFDTPTAAVFTYDKKRRIPAYEAAEKLYQAIKSEFSKKNLFTVLDRDNLKDVIKEQSFTKMAVKLQAMPVPELAKIGHLLSADFILKGKLEKIKYKSKIGFDRKTGKYKSKKKLYLKLHYSLINTATDKLEIEKNIKIKLTPKDWKNLDEDEEEAKLDLILSKAATAMLNDIAMLKKKKK